jgi:hypothetical protein
VSLRVAWVDAPVNVGVQTVGPAGNEHLPQVGITRMPVITAIVWVGGRALQVAQNAPQIDFGLVCVGSGCGVGIAIGARTNLAERA